LEKIKKEVESDRNNNPYLSIVSESKQKIVKESTTVGNFEILQTFT